MRIAYTSLSRQTLLPRFCRRTVVRQTTDLHRGHRSRKSEPALDDNCLFQRSARCAIATAAANDFDFQREKKCQEKCTPLHYDHPAMPLQPAPPPAYPQPQATTAPRSRSSAAPAKRSHPSPDVTRRGGTGNAHPFWPSQRLEHWRG